MVEPQTRPGDQPTEAALATIPEPGMVEDETAEYATPSRRSRGRPTLLEPDTREILLTAIRAGNRLPAAARLAGISPKTLSEWLRRGRGLDARAATPAHMQLVDDVELAQAQAEANALEMIRKAAMRDWRAAAWFLENSHDDWRRRKALPEPLPPPVVEPEPEPDPGAMIVVSPADMRELTRRHLAAKRGDSEDAETTRAALADFIVEESGPDD